VYVHHNNINGKRYIGITNSPKKRWQTNGKKYSNCPRFASALTKYGWGNFTHYFLESDLTLEEASEKEKFYIKKYKTTDGNFGYNIAEGGCSPPTMSGKRHSEETKAKMREKALGRKISEAQRLHHSKVMTGKLVGKLNPKSKAVQCVETGEIFETQREAATKMGLSQSKISLCCQGKRNHTGGYRWKYADNLEV